MNRFKNLLLVTTLALVGAASALAQSVAVGSSISIPVPNQVKSYSTSVGNLVQTTNANTSLSLLGLNTGTTVLTIVQKTGSNIVDTIVVTPKPINNQAVTLNINQTLTLAYPSGTYQGNGSFTPNNGDVNLTSLTQTGLSLQGVKTGTTSLTITTTTAVINYNITVTSQVIATYTSYNFGTGNQQQYQNYYGTAEPNNPSVPTYVTIVPTGNAAYQQMMAYHAQAVTWATTQGFYASGIRHYAPYTGMYNSTSLFGQEIITISYPSMASQIILENTYTTAYLNNVSGSAGTTGVAYDAGHGTTYVAASGPLTPTNAVYGSSAAGGIYNFTGSTYNRGWVSLSRVPNTPLSAFVETSDDDAGYGSSYGAYALVWVAPGALPNDPPPPSGTIQSTTVRALPNNSATMSWTVSNG